MEFLILIGVVVVMIAVVSSGNQFRDNAAKVYVGMIKEELVKVMGQPQMTKYHQDGSFEYIYEKSEWKGIFRGGTQTRRMEVVIDSYGKVISVGKNANVSKSGW